MTYKGPFYIIIVNRLSYGCMFSLSVSRLFKTEEEAWNEIEQWIDKDISSATDPYPSDLDIHIIPSRKEVSITLNVSQVHQLFISYTYIIRETYILD